MQALDDEIETIHLYVVKEKEKRSSKLSLILTCLFLAGLVALGQYFIHPNVVHETLSIPAHFLPLKTFTATQPIIPTGIKTYPAMKAHGMLTLSNGYVITEQLPQGMIFSGQGIEVVTDGAALVPAGSAVGYGVATVSAHAVSSGSQGNIRALTINQVYGTSLYIRNIHPFTGGHDAYSVKVVKPQDRQTALDTARAFLATQTAQIHEFLAFPCKETTGEKYTVLGLSWACQYVNYSVPSYMKVIAVRLVGKNLLVDVVFVARPRRMIVR